MADEYTPSIAQLRSVWVNRITINYNAEIRERVGEFDRAIAAHDAELRAEAWDEGAKGMMRAVTQEQTVSFIAPFNPHRAATIAEGTTK